MGEDIYNIFGNRLSHRIYKELLKINKKNVQKLKGK